MLRAFLPSGADVALIVVVITVNTAHLVEICSEVMPSFLIANSDELLSAERIRHFDIEQRKVVESDGWLPIRKAVRMIVTSGASCPDILMNQVVERIVTLCGYDRTDIEAGLESLCMFEDDV